MRVGLDRRTGELLTGWDECAQSIGVIVTTAVGSLVLNRAFGSDLPGLVDRPGNEETVAACFMAIAEALRKWEPGFRLSKITLASLSAGQIAFDIAGVFYPDGHLGDYANPQGVATTAAAPGLISVGG